ncbi:MAG: SsrA-binding protein SmpB [Spirochaetia bacterium]
MGKKKRKGSDSVAENRKAYFHYEVLETLECGIELGGTEVKSIRCGHVNFVDAFVEIRNHQLFLVKFQISPYAFGNLFNHISDRPRRLLAHKQEISKLWKKVKEKGHTIVPLRVYFKNQFVKVEIGLCRGKKLYDKRETIKERDADRQNQREVRNLTKA